MDSEILSNESSLQEVTLQEVTLQEVTLQEAVPAASGSSGTDDVLLCLQMILVVLVVWFICWVFRGIRTLFSRIGGR